MSNVFADLAPLRDRPIEATARLKAAKAEYKALPADPGHTLAGEPLVALETRGIAGAPAYARGDTPPYFTAVEGAPKRLWARQGVAEKLDKVNARAAQAGIELYVFDAWRPAAVQAFFHDEWMPAYLAKLYPGDDADQIASRVTQYWAAPGSKTRSPSPHSTGAAVDLTLRWIDTGQPFWMGTLFDDAHERAHIDFFERRCEPGSFSDGEARANRRLLHWLMVEEGFVPHPHEWWHFGYGDPIWT
ncbi:MAG: M15 family metallopeptidase, partial [Pseudomonadota bacterium]